MSINSHDESSQAAEVAATLSEPLYFPATAPRLFGWLHRPAVGRAFDTGLVICKPFGYEALCGHRGMRAFAETAAAAGVPTLRFDYEGSGDSAEIEPGADQIGAWRNDVLEAVRELRRHTGVKRVCLLGFRLGALLATLAAEQDADIAGLILVAPVINGGRYLREMRRMRLAATLGVEPSAAVAATEADGSEPGSMELSGYALSAATIASLSQLDLAARPAPSVSGIFLIDRDDLPGAGAWRDALARAAPAVEYAVVPGFVGMMLTAPQFALIPQGMIGVVRDWVVRFALQHSGGQPVRQPAQAAATVPIQQLGLSSGSAAIVERPVRFGADKAMFGIVTQPHESERRRRAVVLVNSGADYHIGAGRMYVSLARVWARRGYVVLRMDLAGLGDSTTRAGEADNAVFPPAAVQDLSAALDFLRADYGSREVALGGLCTAAYHALRAAVEGVPVERILMVNPQNFFWDEEASIEGVQVAEVVRNPRLYLQRIGSAAAWKRLLSGQVNVARIVAIYAHRLRLAAESVVRSVARALHVRLANDLQRELEEVAARGVRMVFVFARGDPGIELLRIQGGSAIERLGDLCRVHIIDNADHEFTRRGARAQLEEVLSEELFAR